MRACEGGEERPSGQWTVGSGQWAVGSQPEADQGGLAGILRRQSIVWIGARLWPPLLAGRRQDDRQRGRAMACTSGRCNGERGAVVGQDSADGADQVGAG